MEAYTALAWITLHKNTDFTSIKNARVGSARQGEFSLEAKLRFDFLLSMLVPVHKNSGHKSGTNYRFAMARSTA
jgi:hypothetical protein